MRTITLIISLLVGCGTTNQTYVYLFRPVMSPRPTYNIGQMPSETSGAVSHPGVDWSNTPGPPLALVTPEYAQSRPANNLSYRLDLRHRLGYKIKQACYRNSTCHRVVQCYYSNNFMWCP